MQNSMTSVPTPTATPAAVSLPTVSEDAAAKTYILKTCLPGVVRWANSHSAQNTCAKNAKQHDQRSYPDGNARRCLAADGFGRRRCQPEGQPTAAADDNPNHQRGYEHIEEVGAEALTRRSQSHLRVEQVDAAQRTSSCPNGHLIVTHGTGVHVVTS